MSEVKVFHRVENIVGNGENAGHQHFLLFPLCFQTSSLIGSLKLKIMWFRVNPLPNDKMLDWLKLKAFADGKINVTEKLKFVLVRVQNIVEKGENAA